MTTLTLEPEGAVLSIKRRLETIEKARAIIVATLDRYDGNAVFEAALAKHNLIPQVDVLRTPPTSQEGA